MKESEAAKKPCPILTTAANVTPCGGSNCVMWEPEYEKETRDLLIDPPTEEGWTKTSQQGGYTHSIIFVRWVPTDSGDCGLKSRVV